MSKYNTKCLYSFTLYSIFQLYFKPLFLIQKKKMSFLLDKIFKMIILISRTQKTQKQERGVMTIDELSENGGAMLYSLSQMVFGNFLPEPFIYALTLAGLVLAVIIEGVVIYLILRWYIRKSIWTIWLKTTFPKLF